MADSVTVTVVGGAVGGYASNVSAMSAHPLMSSGAVGGGHVYTTLEYPDWIKGSFTLPSYSLEAEMECLVFGISYTLPGFTLTASIEEFTWALSVTLPSLSLVAELFDSAEDFGGQAVLTLPAITLVSNAVVTEDQIGLALCLNVETGALTEYENFQFNSFAKINGVWVGANEDGLFLLGGADDAGKLIDARFRLARNNFGFALFKRMWNAYLGHKNSDGCSITSIDAEANEYDGVTLDKTGDDFKVQRAKVNHRVKSTYWGLEYANVDGADFEVDNVELTAEMINRRA